MKQIKVLRIVTVPISFATLLKGQPNFLKKNGFEVLLCSSDGKEIDEIIKKEGCELKKIEFSRKITPFRDLISLIKVYLLIKTFKPDIVHTHTPKAGLVGMLAAFIARTPIRLHTVAGLPLMETSGFKKNLLIKIEKLVYYCAKRIYPNSDGLRDYILENIYNNEDKLKVIGKGSSNGINLDYFNLKNFNLRPNELKNQLNIKQNDFIFIYAGRIVKDKGINELLFAFNRLSHKHKDIKLLLVGNLEEDLNPISKESFKILKSNNKIIQVGFQKDVRPYYAISNALTFPSYREGFPNTVLQSCAMELPCIVTNINGSNEIIKHEINGLVIRKKDSSELYKAMNRFLEDKQLYNKLKINTRKRIEDSFDQKIIWNQILSEYNKLLNNV